MPRVRTGFSFRTAVGKLEDVMARVKECDYAAAPITDRASTFGYVKWSKLCKKNNIKPVYGIELAVTDDLTAKKSVTDYWTFLAKDSLLPINKLVELATEQFYYESQISFEQALAAEGVYKIVGYRSPMNLIEPQEDLFIGLAPSCSKGYITLARDVGHQFVLCSDNKYAHNTDDDRFLYEVIVGRDASTQIYPQHIMTMDEWYASVERRCTQDDVQQAYDNFQFILDNSKAELRQATLLVPDKPATLLEMCQQGAVKLSINLNDEVYAARLERELKLIAEKKFEDYFYIIADLCQWSRQRMAVGPARGSTAGSLVCYLLGITMIDPIPYGLIFERFVDLQRNDLPDCDLDFSADRREMAMEYLANKYGQDRMARIGSVAMYKPPSALKEAGMALQVPKWKCDAVAESLLKRSSGDARALDSLEDTFKAMPAGRELIAEYPEMAVAARMEGHPRHSSQHAAGVILTNEPVNHYVAIDKRVNAAMCDKKDAEELNLLKIDMLGLTQLSVFEYALQLAGLPENALDSIPMDDKDAFKVLNDAKFCGIFQFNGMALQSIVKQFEVTKFDDIVSITALARPGPLASGGAHEWVRRKNGVHEITYPHEIFEPYLKDTLGIVLYQENVMQIGRDIGDLDWADVTALRKAMSKSLGVEYFDQFGDRFKKGARRYITDEKVLYDLWTGLCSMGCLSGETELINPHPNQFYSQRTTTLKALYESDGIVPYSKCNRRQKLLSWDGTGLKPNSNVAVVYSGQKETWLVKTKSGLFIRPTMEHEFMVPDFSFKKLSQLQVGSLVMVKGRTPPTARKSIKGNGRGAQNRWPIEKSGGVFLNGKRGNRNKVLERDPICTRCNNKPTQEVHHINLDHEDHRMENLAGVCRSCHKLYHREAGVVPVPYQKGKSVVADEIIFIGDPKVEDVYDIEMPAPNHNYLANDFVVHNSWVFNKSHAVSYGIISYQTCWLKAHFPFEFAAATLSYEGNKDKQIKLLREMVEEGYDYVAIDPEQSSDKWTVGTKDGRRVLVGPFTNVKGIGPKTIEKIKQYRASGQVLPKALRDKLNTAVNTVGSLIPITDAFKRVLPACENKIRGMAAQSIPIKNIVIKDKDYPVTICCVLSKINPRDENEAINIARRGGKVIEGPDTASLNLQLTDDTDTIFGKIRRQDYQRLGKPIVDRGHTGKHLYIMRGTFKCDSRSSFRIVMIGDVHYIGEVAEEKIVAKTEEKESDQMSLFSVIEKQKATALSLE